MEADQRLELAKVKTFTVTLIALYCVPDQGARAGRACGHMPRGDGNYVAVLGNREVCE